MVNVEQILRSRLSRGAKTKHMLLGLTLMGLTLVSLSGFSEAASAQSLISVRGTARIQVVGRAGPTQAWVSFCQHQPRECHIDLSQPTRIALTPGIWAALTQVNERVNSSILAVTDQDHWGVLDRWDYPDDGLGDCEDIQLLKRKLLVQAGLPHRALRMTAVIDDQGQGHAVLMVLTDQGDFILDNKRNAILPWRRTGYTFIKREGTSGKAWVALGDQAAPTVTANR
jgi:predicted transglutaminase-like cysteine proteinase